MTTNLTTPRRRAIVASMLAAAAVTGVLGSTAPAAAASDKYVALSYSPSYRHYAFGINENKDAAVGRSMFACNERAGACQLLAWSKNGCVALAQEMAAPTTAGTARPRPMRSRGPSSGRVPEAT